MIGQLVTSLRLCSALLVTHGAEVSSDRLCRAAVIVAHVANLAPRGEGLQRPYETSASKATSAIRGLQPTVSVPVNLNLNRDLRLHLSNDLVADSLRYTISQRCLQFHRRGLDAVVPCEVRKGGT